MRVLLLAGAVSIHTIRWANGLARAGQEVYLITQHPCVETCDDRVAVIRYPYMGIAGYFFMVPFVQRLLQRIRPDILNVHYASGYGTTARLAGYRPYVLSVWGSDVYDFPNRSRLHLWWLRRNLEAADRVASTSVCMACQTKRIAPELGDIAVTPFGVDVDRFATRAESGNAGSEDSDIVIGTVKSLEHKYGVDTLIRAFARLRRDMQAVDQDKARRLRLRIVGDGSDQSKLQALARECHVADVTHFVGRVSHGKVPEELSRMDVFAALSRLDSESFGVAVLEASSARLPVVVSDAGGLPEVVVQSSTGIIVPRDNPEEAALALGRLVKDRRLRAKMGEAGHAFVRSEYSWSASVQKMLNVLKETLAS